MSTPAAIAIVGAGPSGFYAADALLRANTPGRALRVDLIDRLPTPFGLVRGGVAPDHQNIKRITRAFEKTARHEHFRFLGNVTLGEDLTVEELKAHYHAIIYAVGNESFRTLGIPGESSPRVRSATEFVFWYNGHPDYSDRHFDLRDVRQVVIVGVGNVAMDVARILARPPETLKPTDIAGYALDALRESAVEEIVIVGRRGPAQAAFSLKEIKELHDLSGATLVISPEQAALDPVSDAWLGSEDAPPTAAAIVEWLQSVAGPPPDAGRIMRLEFCASPTAFQMDAAAPEGVQMVRNRLEPSQKRPRPVVTAETWTQPAQLVLTAIGYRGIPIPGVPFRPDWGLIPNEDGRVLDGPDGPRRAGEYVVGWAKRGPSGLIGSNRPDARGVVALLLDDLPDLPQPPSADRDLIDQIAHRGVRVVRYADWKRLDAEEIRRGQARGAVRLKFTDVTDMLEHLDPPQG
ncbi:MAG: FAD-dependent oxidoreductase [Myxococcota bacterium]